MASVGVRPTIVVGQGVGELAAAQAAGTLDLEAGLRQAALGAAPGEAASNSPAETLADGGAEVIVEIGFGESASAPSASARPAAGGGAATPLFLSLLRPPTGKAPAADDHREFVAAVAEAYEAGVPVSFAGLFAGEERRRISLPEYPFERRRFWIGATPR